MAIQYPLAGFPAPIFINETGTKDYPLSGTTINETSPPAPDTSSTEYIYFARHRGRR